MSYEYSPDLDQGFYSISEICKMPPRLNRKTGERAYPASNSRSRLPLSRTRWNEGVAVGDFPAPVKLGGMNVWPKAEIHRLEKEIADGGLKLQPIRRKETNPTKD
jgi:hypothetical protein